ncbi:MAG: HAMP domain-containing protein [Ruminococcaceae bacterium]|nr:HAMP domain-containing protein [Oscillospiraceae bacterium]
MKLRTKLVIISSIILLFALLLTDFFVLDRYSDNAVKEATSAGCNDSLRVKYEFESFFSGFSGNNEKQMIAYHFKYNQELYTVCYKNGEEYYNNTVFSLEELESGKWHDSFELPYKKLDYKDKRLLVFKFDSFGSSFFNIVDITDTYEKIFSLAVTMAFVSLAVTVISVILISLIIQKTLSPLKLLSEGTKSIAGGDYSKRVAVKSSNEIGSLANDFNSMAEAIEKHSRELSESEKRTALLMANLTHELKTPLTAISGYAQSLRALKLSDSDKDEALAYIDGESKRLDRLSKKMIRLLEIDRNTDIAFEEIAVDRLFDEVIRTCSSFAETKSVELVKGKCDGVIFGDFDLLCTVFINLTDNAIKASENGSSVELFAENNGLFVRDHGMGIPEDEISRITEPFYMVDKSRSRKNGGSGLGLALVKVILKHHGFTLRIESQPNIGSTFGVITETE